MSAAPHAPTPARLPFRGAHGAPSFDGTPTHLNRFFSDLDLTYAALGLTPTDQERVTQAIYYLDADTAFLWETLSPPGAAWTWDTFKTAVRELYPGSDSTARLYSVTDLERVVQEWAARGIFTRGELGDYFRSFTLISRHLLSNGRIDQNTLNRLYVQGFGNTTRRRIEHRLSIVDVNHHPDDPYSMTSVQDAAQFLLSATSPTPPPASGPAPATFSVPETQVKKETFDLSNLASILTNMQSQISTLTQAVAGGQRNRPGNAGNSNQSGPATCAMCKKPDCRVRSCNLTEELIRKGKAIWNSQGRIALPDGSQIPWDIPGNGLFEKIERWHQQNPGRLAQTVPTVSTNVYLASTNSPVVTAFNAQPSAYITELADEDEEDEQADEQISILQSMLANEIAKKNDRNRNRNSPPGFKNLPRPVVEIPAAPKHAPKTTTPPAVPGGSTSPSAATGPILPAKDRAPAPVPVPQKPTPPAPAAAPRPPSNPSVPAQTTHVPPGPSSSTSLPAAQDPPSPPKDPRNVTTPPPANMRPPPKDQLYQFQAPAESAVLLKDVVERALDSPFPISHRELLAVAPDIRKQLRDMTTVKRVPVVLNDAADPVPAAEVLFTHAIVDDKKVLVADHAAPLRVITGTLMGKVEAEILLDSGSSIVAIKRSVWEELQTPIRSDLILHMESSHCTVESTCGLLQNFPITLGPCTFYLQVQVSENLPCDVLLGRPFFMLTSAVTQDFPDGRQELVLSDPNTGSEIRLATTERTGEPSKRKRVPPGF